jgi:menaquinone-specific isochorismate synthase
MYPKFFFDDGEESISVEGAIEHFDAIPDVIGDERYVGVKNHFFLPRQPCEFPSVSEEKNLVLARIDLPTFSEWRCNVEKALQAIEANRISKVVLARRTELHFQKAINPIAVLEKLKMMQKNAAFFLYQPEEGIAFVGASPEKLYRREENLLLTDSLAGTRKRGKDREEDLFLEKELLQCKKERQEFAYVSDFLQEELSKLCSDVAASELSVKKCARVQHLHQEISGTLQKGVTDAMILNALNPTPAIGGFPRDPALALARILEPFERGWYSAPIGWISRNKARFAVAIRSAIIQGKTMQLFAGAGIVKGSDPKREWEELEHKIEMFL